MKSFEQAHSVRFPENSASARLILPVLFQVAGRFDSAVDVGGGTGAWTQVLQETGMQRAVCIDTPEMDLGELLISPDDFIACDFSKAFPDIIKSDLALCLENAEHLPEAQAGPLVTYLTSCAEVVLFGAAIPGQPSLYHINEQPHAYWKALFKERGFLCFDCIRPHIADNPEIPYWYRQNLFVFAREETAAARHLKDVAFARIPDDFELIHERVVSRYRVNRLGRVKDIPAILMRSFAARFGRS